MKYLYILLVLITSKQTLANDLIYYIEFDDDLVSPYLLSNSIHYQQTIDSDDKQWMKNIPEAYTFFSKELPSTALSEIRYETITIDGVLKFHRPVNATLYKVFMSHLPINILIIDTIYFTLSSIILWIVICAILDVKYFYLPPVWIVVLFLFGGIGTMTNAVSKTKALQHEKFQTIMYLQAETLDQLITERSQGWSTNQNGSNYYGQVWTSNEQLCLVLLKLKHDINNADLLSSEEDSIDIIDSFPYSYAVFELVPGKIVNQIDFTFINLENFIDGFKSFRPFVEKRWEELNCIKAVTKEGIRQRTKPFVN